MTRESVSRSILTGAEQRVSWPDDDRSLHDPMLQPQHYIRRRTLWAWGIAGFLLIAQIPFSIWKLWELIWSR